MSQLSLRFYYGAAGEGSPEGFQEGPEDCSWRDQVFVRRALSWTTSVGNWCRRWPMPIHVGRAGVVVGGFWQFLFSRSLPGGFKPWGVWATSFPHSCKLPISISFASSPLIGPVGHNVIPTLIRSWRCSCSRNICREKPVFAGKVTCGVRNETSGQSWPSNTVATDPFTGQNRNSKCGSGIQHKRLGV